MRLKNSSKLSLAVMAALLGLATAPAPAHAAPGNGNKPAAAAKGRILVQTKAGLSASAFNDIIKPYGGKGRKMGQSNLHVVELPAGAIEADVVAKLSRHPNIKFAELDRLVPLNAIPNDPYFGAAYHLPLIGTPSAWDSTYGAGVTIAVLDSGVDSTHPDLSPNLLPGYNMVDRNFNTSDVCGHGTAVAGAAAAATDNAMGVSGVAGKAKILPVRVGHIDPATGQCSGYYSNIADGLIYAADNGARIANASFAGLSGSAAVISAAEYMKSKGGLVFVSAGNTGVSEAYPETTALVSVSATDSNDQKAAWSSYGPFVTLAAPGDLIATTSVGGAYQQWSGTSFASPVAAGVGALVMAANPNLDGAKVEELLYTTATDLGTAGRDTLYGYGRVDAARAVAAARALMPQPDVTPPTATITTPTAGQSVSGVVSVNVDAQDNVGVARVELKVNNTTVASEQTAPYSLAWDTNGTANGMANLVAVAYDAAGNSQGSSVVAVNVANATLPPPQPVDVTPPVVRITNPVAGSVSGTVVISATATDDWGAAGITQTIYVDNVAKASGTGSTLSYSWATKGQKGTHTIHVVARDKANNSSSASVSVVVK